MQALGASAVIVSDNEYRRGLVPMGSEGDTSDITIPSSFITLCTLCACAHTRPGARLL